MKKKITGYHKDEEGHWVAELECGHGQHVRHDPPWMERDWVLTKEGRNGRVGHELNCVRCNEATKALMAEVRRRLVEAYEQAGMSGLCEEGRWEAALGALDSLVRD